MTVLNPNHLIRTRRRFPVAGLVTATQRIHDIADGLGRSGIAARAAEVVASAKAAVDADAAYRMRLVGSVRVARPDHAADLVHLRQKVRELAEAVTVATRLPGPHTSLLEEVGELVKACRAALKRAQSGAAASLVDGLVGQVRSARFAPALAADRVLTIHVARAATAADAISAARLLGEPPRAGAVKAEVDALHRRVDGLVALILAQTVGQDDVAAQLLRPVEELSTQTAIHAAAVRAANKAKRLAKEEEAAKADEVAPPVVAVGVAASAVEGPAEVVGSVAQGGGNTPPVAEVRTAVLA